MDKKGFHTKCVHGSKNSYDNTGAISVPIYQSATFVHEGLGHTTGFDYSRLKNPTREQLEKTVSALEGGLDALAFTSGMAAISTLMELFEPGDHIIASDDLYGGSYRHFNIIAMKKGIQFDFVNTSHLDEVEKRIRANTKAFFIETPTNPMMNVTDIRGIGELAKRVDGLVIVDNTFMTPYLQQPLKLGADVVVHSGTKYLGGHNDTLAGVLVVQDQDILERLRVLSKTLGACLAPFDSWLILRGIKTLPIRMEQQEENAHALANWLKDQQWINKVHYIGLPEHPGHEIIKRQAAGFGAMISIEVTEETLVERILGRLSVVKFAESLGGAETLITYPNTQTHADVPEEERNRKGITNRLLRISVGLENVDDIIADLKQAVEE